jgi:hypothetical protein
VLNLRLEGIGVTHIEVMKQSLKTLETMDEWLQRRGYSGLVPDERKLVDALRTAIEKEQRDWSMLEAAQESLREHMAEIGRLKAIIEQAEKQEPVPVLEVVNGQINRAWDAIPADFSGLLYTASPAAQRQPLTDEQIDELWREATLKPALTSEFVRSFTRAIEAAHGIK